MTTSAAAAAAGADTTTVNNTVNNGSLPFNTSFHDELFNVTTTLSPLPNSTTDGQDFFHHLTLKDETTFVALIVMGVVVPAIFITVFFLICRQRRKDLIARRTQMLLQNAQDFALEDYTSVEKAASPPRKL